MKQRVTILLAALVLGTFAFTVSACCGGENSEKTAECKDKKNNDECKACCGGNYSYLGEGSCTCY